MIGECKPPVALNGNGRSPGLVWPHSVAWISQWLAEPRTRVRIAVGPFFFSKLENTDSERTVVKEPRKAHSNNRTIPWLFG